MLLLEYSCLQSFSCGGIAGSTQVMIPIQPGYVSTAVTRRALSAGAAWQTILRLGWVTPWSESIWATEIQVFESKWRQGKRFRHSSPELGWRRIGRNIISQRQAGSARVAQPTAELLSLMWMHRSRSHVGLVRSWRGLYACPEHDTRITYTCRICLLLRWIRMGTILTYSRTNLHSKSVQETATSSIVPAWRGCRSRFSSTKEGRVSRRLVLSVHWAAPRCTYAHAPAALPYR